MRTLKYLTSYLGGACMSSFDPDAFLNTNVEGQMEAKFTPLPEDDYFDAYVEKLEAKEFKNGDTGEMQKALVVTVAILDQKAKAFMGMEKPTVKHNIFLDFDDSGRLSFGKNKNIQLGALREAVGQNTASAWSFRMLEGAGPFAVKITHRFAKDGQGPFANIARMAKPGEALGKAKAA